MAAQFSPRLISPLRSISRGAGVAASLVGCLVLVGWVLDVGALKSVLPDSVAMKVNTALGFLLSGLSLFILSAEPADQLWRRIGQGCAVVVALIGLLTLSEYLLRWDLGIDQLLITERSGAVGTAHPGRMAAPTAQNFLMIGLALLLLTTPRGFGAVQLLTLAAGFIGLLNFIGYAYGVSSLYGIASHTNMAVHTAVTFMVLSAGILFSRPGHGLMATFASGDVGGTLVRRLLPAAVVVLFLLGWLRVIGQRAGLYDTEFGAAIFVLSTVIVMALLIWWSARSLNREVAERRRAEEELDRFFALALDMVCIAGFDGYFKRLNTAWEKALGFTVEELTARPFLDFVHPEDREATIAAAARQTEHGLSVISFENRYLCKDGSHRWLLWSSTPLAETQTLYAIARDITERKRADEGLARLAAIVDSSQDAIIGKALDGVVTSWNRGAEQLYGYSAEEVVGRSIGIIIPPDRPGEMPSIYDRIARGEGVQNFETRRVAKDGRELDVSLTVSPIRDARGDIIGASAIARDMTEHKRLAEALRESEDRHRTIVDTAVDGIITIDDRGLVESLNPSAERMFGYAAGEVLGQNLKMLMPAPYRDVHDGYLSRYRKTGERRIIGIGREVEGRRKDGTTFPLELSVSEVERGKRRQYVGIVRDISERKRAEEELARHTDALARSNAELEDFTHVVSHDLKEPLRGIEAFSTFLEEEYSQTLDDQGRRYIDVLRGSAIRMRELIDDLLKLSRVGRSEPEYVRYPMESLLEEVAENMEFALKEKSATLQVEPDLPTITCDPLRLRQVFENLISNAIKYCDKREPAIRVSSTEDAGFYTFTVADNGPGIDPRYHDKIFEVFQRLVHREEHAGTGIGLAICKKIVEGHGGKVWVESDGQGNGSTFFFSIPKSLRPARPSRGRTNGDRDRAGAHPAR